MDEATREELEDVLAHLDLNVSRLRTPIAASCPAHSPVSAMSRAFRIRPIEDRDRADVVRVLTQSWHSSVIVTRGRSFDCSLQPGLVAEIDGRLKGLVTYHLQDGECEVLSLDSLQEGIGIGTALLDAIAEEARASGCRRAFLITTNDNIGAIRFYQKRGWRMVAVYPGAVDKSRKIKPAIPLTGSHGIAIRDEIEFELRFGA
jgi:ribosomal protein S18 acetylase RimI-like enzyme